MTKEEVLLMLGQLSEEARKQKQFSISTSTYDLALRVTVRAFRAYYKSDGDKHIFTREERKRAAEALENSLKWFKQAYLSFSISINVDQRQKAQMSLSGLRFMIDELKNEMKNSSKAEQLFSCEPIEFLLDFIRKMTGVEPEYVEPEMVKKTQIPPSHWWFYLEEEKEKDDDDEVVEMLSDETDQETDWNNKIAEWKEAVKQIQKHYYLSFHGSQFHDLNGFPEEFQINKILYAMYGPPIKVPDKKPSPFYSLQESYSKEARENAKKIYEKIYEEFKKTHSNALELSVTFVCYIHKKKGRQKFPVFSIPLTNGDRLFIDTNGSVHRSWTEWIKSAENLICCYPKFGFYTCSEDRNFNFDPQKDPILEFSPMPKNHQYQEQLPYFRGDYFGINSSFLLSGDFMNDPLLIGLWPSTTDTATITEELPSLKRINEMLEMLCDSESYLEALQKAPLSQDSRLMTFSKLQRLLAAIVIVSKESSLRKHFFFLVNILTVFEKKNLDTLDFLQFSANMLFFLNIHYGVGKAKRLIKDFNREDIDHIAKKLSDKQTKQVFSESLAINKDSNGSHNERVVRAINYIKNREEFFQQTPKLSLTADLDNNDPGMIVKNLNRQKIDLAHKRIQFIESKQNVPARIQRTDKLFAALGDLELEQHSYLSKLTTYDQDDRINFAIRRAAEYQREIVEMAEKLADQLQDRKITISAGAFLSLVEIVAVEKEKKRGISLDATVINKLVEEIVSDLTAIDKIQAEVKLKFADSFLALYHYRKHGNEFRKNCDLQFYLKELPNRIQTQGKVSTIHKITTIDKNGSTKIMYKWTFILEDNVLVINYSNDEVTPSTISTICKNFAISKEYEEEIEEKIKWNKSNESNEKPYPSTKELNVGYWRLSTSKNEPKSEKKGGNNEKDEQKSEPSNQPEQDLRLSAKPSEQVDEHLVPIDGYTPCLIDDSISSNFTRGLTLPDCIREVEEETKYDDSDSGIFSTSPETGFDTKSEKSIMRYQWAVFNPVSPVIEPHGFYFFDAPPRIRRKIR